MKTAQSTTTCSELTDAGREFYRRGWVLGTSGNFSVLMSREPMRICITASGGDKGKLDETGFLPFCPGVIGSIRKDHEIRLNVVPAQAR